VEVLRGDFFLKDACLMSGINYRVEIYINKAIEQYIPHDETNYSERLEIN